MTLFYHTDFSIEGDAYERELRMHELYDHVEIKVLRKRWSACKKYTYI